MNLIFLNSTFVRILIPNEFEFVNVKPLIKKWKNVCLDKSKVKLNGLFLLKLK